MSLDLAQSLYSSHFIENIWSDKLSLDSYEPTNLISLNNIQRSNGYITEYYIKPPVNLYINFKYPIDLNQIVLEPQSGKQRTKDFIISASHVASKNGGLVQGGNMSKNNINIDENSFYFLAQTNINHFSNITDNCIKKYIVFKNNNYVPLVQTKNLDKLDILSNSAISLNNESIVFPFKIYNKKTLNISSLKICLKSVYNSSSVVLKSIQIYGKPHDVNTLNSLLDNFKISKMVAKIDYKPNQKNLNNNDNYKSNTSVHSNFLDSLTYEIMKEPVILPSGHYIDITSLNKLMNEQKKFGNFPIDPFTGIPFDNNYLPSLNKKLKSEVEKYCSKLSSTKKITKFDNFINKSLHQSSNNINSIENDFLNVKNLDHDKLTYALIHKDLFLCSFCYNINKKMYNINPCGHLICKDCIKSKFINIHDKHFPKNRTIESTVIDNNVYTCISGCLTNLSKFNIKRKFNLPQI